MSLTIVGSIVPQTVQEIAALPDDAYRNQWITFGYDNISRQLVPLVGKNATWFTFARWSSSTVGENLRTDAPSPAFDAYISQHSILRFVRGPLLRLQQDLRAINDAAMPRLLALGNQLVFREIAYEATRFLEWHARTSGDLTTWPSFRGSIAADQASSVFAPAELAWLRDGLEAYLLASRAPAKETKADLVLRGNILLAAYEQWRLSPVLKLALDPIAKHLVEFRDASSAKPGEPVEAVVKRAGTPWSYRHRSPVVQWCAEQYAALLTRSILAWDAPVPGPDIAPVFLGQPVPDAGSDPLQRITDERARHLFELYDRSTESELGYGTQNWARFADRMNAVVHLFRAQQSNPRLYDELSVAERRVLDLDLTDTNFDRLRQEGDADMRKIVDAFGANEHVQPRQLVRRLVDEGVLAQPVLSSTAALPSWKDDELIREGQQFLAKNGLEIGAALFTASLPYSYTGAHGAQVLVHTAQLASGHTTRRIAETGQLILDLMTIEEPPLALGTRASNSLRGVRLFHEAIRQMITQEPGSEWDTTTLGVPINQEDLLGVLIVFTVIALDTLTQLGISYSEREADAYIHLWLVAGHLLGIDYARVRRGEVAVGPPLTLAELRLIAATILRRQAAPSPEGATLMASLARATEAQMPSVLRGYPTAATRHFIGRDNADMLEIGHSSVGHVLYDSLRVISRMAAIDVHGALNAVVGRIGTKNLFNFWINENRGSRPPWRVDAVPNWKLKGPPS